MIAWISIGVVIIIFLVVALVFLLREDRAVDRLVAEFLRKVDQ